MTNEQQKCTCGNPDAGNPNVGRAVHNYDGSPCHVIPTENPLNLALSTTMEMNMGDHGERVTVVHEYVPGETIEDLVYRLFPALGGNWSKHNAADKITIKVVVNKNGTISGEVPIGHGLKGFDF